MAKIKYLFLLIIFILPYTSFALCYEAFDFTNTDANGVYIDNATIYNGDPEYINSNSVYLYHGNSGLSWFMSYIYQDETFMLYYRDGGASPEGIDWDPYFGASPAGYIDEISCDEAQVQKKWQQVQLNHT